MKQLYQSIILLMAIILPSTATANYTVDGIHYNINGNEATVTYFYSYFVLDENAQWYDEGHYECFSHYSGDVTIPMTVTINDKIYSVTSIGDSAFYGSTSLTSIYIPNSVTSIGKHAFSGCTGLANVSIGNSVTSIDNNAFRDCTGLTSVNIPNSVTSIGKYAFSGCTGLASVHIGNSVNTIDQSAFFGCTSLTSIIISSDNQTFDSRENCNAIIETANNTLRFGCKSTVIPSSVTSIGESAFLRCTGLTSVNIPNSVTSIGGAAFYRCTGLTSMDIGDSVTSIGNSAFSGCTGLTSINIPNSVSSIGDNAFSGCTSLTSVGIGGSVTSIGNSAFENCIGLKSINIPNSVISIGNSTFLNCIVLTNVDFGNSVTSIGNSAFSGCTSLTSINIPNSVSSIGESAFMRCTGLTSASIGNSVTTIYNDAFNGCTRLKTLYFNAENCGDLYYYAYPFGVLGDPELILTPLQCFTNCPIEEIVIGDQVTRIPAFLMYNNTYLTHITISHSVQAIGAQAFYGCANLSTITCLPMTPPILEDHIDSVSYMPLNNYYATLYVQEEAYDAYSQANYWKNFANIVGIVTIENFEVDGIYYHALTDSTAMVIQYPEDEFYSGDVVIPEVVTYQDVPFTVKDIDSGAFDGCDELSSVVIGDAVETIGEEAFQGCTGLTRLTIGSGVATIGARAFNYCNALQMVISEGTVPPVMESSNCFSSAAYRKATLKVPRLFVDSYVAADYWYNFEHIEGYGSAGPGDTNADGIINISDITAMINIMLTGEGEYHTDADLNHNGIIDIGDVTSLIYILLTSK